MLYSVKHPGLKASDPSNLLFCSMGGGGNVHNIWSLSCKRYFEICMLLPIYVVLFFLRISHGSDKLLILADC